MTTLVEHAGPVLVAVDLSEHSQLALAWGARTASAFGVPLVILHVVHDPAAAPGYYRGAHTDDMLRTMEDQARSCFEDFLADNAAVLHDLPHTATRMAVGLPVARVIEVADELDAQLVVVGSHGRTGLDRLRLGSKAERIARLCPVPVAIVKRPSDQVSS